MTTKMSEEFALRLDRGGGPVWTNTGRKAVVWDLPSGRELPYSDG